MTVRESWAWEVARAELAGPLPRRWAHSQGVARAAAELAMRLNTDGHLLASSSVLHDVGYAPRLAKCGFHPLDGARYLRDQHNADDRLTRLVANHTYALMEAEERGLREELEAEFPVLDDQFLVDAITYCDMTTTPDGARTSALDRITEIIGRYGPDTIVGRFIQRASPDIMASVQRIERMLLDQPR